MRFQFIENHRHEYAVKTMYRTLEVSECGYYAWSKRPKSQRDQNNEELTQRIFSTCHQEIIYGHTPPATDAIFFKNVRHICQKRKEMRQNCACFMVYLEGANAGKDSKRVNESLWPD